MASLRGRNKNAQKEEVEVTQEEVKKEEVQEAEVQEVKVETQKPKTQPNVRIKPNADLRTVIGDTWYTFKKGVQVNVPQQVKDILAKAGYLDVL